MPLYTLVEVPYWKASNANKQNIFRNKFHNLWDVDIILLSTFTNC